MLEFSPTRYRDLGQDPAAFIDEMEKAGYRLNSLDHFGQEKPFGIASMPMAIESGDYADLVLRK